MPHRKTNTRASVNPNAGTAFMFGRVFYRCLRNGIDFALCDVDRSLENFWDRYTAYKSRVTLKNSTPRECGPSIEPCLCTETAADAAGRKRKVAIPIISYRVDPC